MQIVKQQPTELQEAMKSQKAADMLPQDLSRKLIDILSAIHLYAGKQTEASDLVTQARFLLEDIQRDFRWIRIDEIKIAMNVGVRGAYGEYFGLNNKTYSSWLTSFRSSENRVKTVNAIRAEQKRLPEKAELTDQEKEEIFQRALATTLVTFNRTQIPGQPDSGEVWDPGNTVYDGLDRRGKIKFTTEQKNEYVRAAEKSEYTRLTEERKDSMIRGHRLDVKKIEGQINELMNETIPDKVISVAKRLALKDWIINHNNNPQL